MKEVYQILIHSSEIICLVFGIIGFVTFVLLVFFMDKLTELSEWFNKEFNVKDRVYKTMNRQIETESIIFSYPRFFGLLLFLTSLWALIFITQSFDAGAVIKALKFTKVQSDLAGVILSSFSAILKIFGVMGVISSLCLLLLPKLFRKWCYKIDRWYQTDQFEETLDAMRRDTDQICYLHPFATGVFGLFFSSILLILSVLNLLH